MSAHYETAVVAAGDDRPAQKTTQSGQAGAVKAASRKTITKVVLIAAAVLALGGSFGLIQAWSICSAALKANFCP